MRSVSPILIKSKKFYRTAIFNNMSDVIEKVGKAAYLDKALVLEVGRALQLPRGVEGYVESAASGIWAAVNCARRLCGMQPFSADTRTVIGALAAHVSSPNADFQPMNANYGVLEPLCGEHRDKAAKRRAYAERALETIDNIKKEYRL